MLRHNMDKLQITNPKLQTNSKSQIPMFQTLVWNFGFWYCLGFGAWDLEFLINHSTGRAINVF
jgi:hypothetical protein